MVAILISPIIPPKTWQSEVSVFTKPRHKVEIKLWQKSVFQNSALNPHSTKERFPFS